MGHETVMAHVTFFSYTTDLDDKSSQLDLSRDFVYQDELLEDLLTENESNTSPKRRIQFALLEFDKPVTCCESCLVIGSKLDSDINANICRIAFNGVLLKSYADPKYRDTELAEVKIFKTKRREGQVERVNDAYTLIAKNLFKKETNIQAFANLKVKLSSGEDGIIEGGFGQSGKVKIQIPSKKRIFFLSYPFSCELLHLYLSSVEWIKPPHLPKSGCLGYDTKLHPFLGSIESALHCHLHLGPL